ncbi:MAG: CocE/NonD family hydrolase [Alphaproteobacteria bacterium]|nr:CocE/NonD family hydrolase [Alphaproteobacteria bacterium]
MPHVVDMFPHRVCEIENAWIPMPDGCRLAAKIWLPEGAERSPVPTILEYIPYRKRDRQALEDGRIHRYVAGHGYACVRLDIRGSGDSEGVLRDEYLPGEQDDAVAALAWIAAQPWCDGAIGMMGISWGGFNSLQVAARRPPGLKAIITVCSTDDRYADDMHYMGGAVLMDTMGWGATFLGYLPTPPDPALLGDRWRAMWLERLEAARPPALAWLEHQTRDAYWKQGSVCEDYAAIQCAVYAVGGWADGYSSAIPRLMRGLTCPKKALIGPWGHCYPYESGPGPLIGFLQECLRWWDHWLKGRDTGIMAEPPIRAWMQASEPPKAEPGERRGRWVAETTWSGQGDGFRTVPLGDAGAGVLGLMSPQTIGMASSDWCPYGLGPDMPIDQRTDDGGSLCFDGATLDAPTEILGAPVVEFDLVVDRPNAVLTARLCDLFPDGTSVRVTYGILNLTHRDGHALPRPMRPGERTRVRLVLRDVAYGFPAGHCIRLAVSTSYWPVAWPAPEAVTLQIHPATSTLSLPWRRPKPEDAKLSPFEPPACARPPLHTVLRTPWRGRRVIERDVASGAARIVSARDRGMIRLDDIDLAHEGWGEDVHTIREGDPLSARTETRRRVGYSRGAWSVRIESRTELTADRDAFRFRADLDAFEGSDRVFARSWNVAIPRNGV